MNFYFYIHDLPQIIDANKQLFLDRIFRIENNLRYFLCEDAPKIYSKSRNDDFQKVELKRVIADKQPNFFGVIVEFADGFATKPPESTMIEITVDKNDNIRVFNYELDFNQRTGKKEMWVGEFDSHGAHKNFGRTNKEDLNEFADKVVEILSK